MSSTSSVSRSHVLRRRGLGVTTLGSEGATWVTRSDYEGWAAGPRLRAQSVTHTEPPLSRRGLLAAGAAAMGFRLLGYHEAALAATPRAGIAAALQTAAGLENTAVHMYDSVQMLPSTVSGSSILALARLLSTARTHHVQHAAAFNAASVSAGARARSDGDPAMEAAMVSPGLASINGAADVLRLAEAVESALEATYASFCAQVDDARSLVALSEVAPV